VTPAELVAALVSLAALLDGGSPDMVGAALGTQFALESETPYATIWQAPGAPPVSRWELRLPKPGASFAGLVTADLISPGPDPAALAEALAPYEEVSFDVVSPPLDGPTDWVDLTSSCHALPGAQLCVSWAGRDPARATALTLEAGVPAQ